MQSLLFGHGVIFLLVGIHTKHGTAGKCNRKHVTITELRDIFIGRCVEYQTSLHPQYFCATGLKNCTDLWVKFFTAFNDKPQCNVTASLYINFIAAANHRVTGKQLFYSGVRNLAQWYSSEGTRYTTIENTFIGYLINGVHFCDRTTGNSSYESCEAWNPVTCPNTASGSFWEAASTNFAKNAVGDVYVLLNGTRNPIFKSSSYFTKYEAPNLRGGTVTKLTAILINDSPKTKRDLCNNDDSLKILKSIVKTKGIEFVCKENPRDLVYLFCIDNSSTDLCTSVNMYHDGNASTCRACFSPQLLLLLLALLNVLK